jgi:hypothetical protein
MQKRIKESKSIKVWTLWYSLRRVDRARHPCLNIRGLMVPAIPGNEETKTAFITSLLAGAGDQEKLLDREQRIHRQKIKKEREKEQNYGTLGSAGAEQDRDLRAIHV